MLRDSRLKARLAGLAVAGALVVLVPISAEAGGWGISFGRGGHGHYGHGYYGHGRSHFGHYGHGHFGHSRYHSGYHRPWYHNTGHYDYIPGHYHRHYDHYDYHPGAYYWHNTGHWHH